MKEPKVFTYRDSKNVEHTVSFDQGDFALTQFNQKLTDVKMKSKPTTFFKDAFRRFAKNKSSVAGAIILGTILLMTIFVPIFDTNSLDTSDPNLSYQTKLAPKLFEAGTGFWDGTRKYENIAIAFDWDAYEKDGTYSGSPASGSNSSFDPEAILGGISYSAVGENKIDGNAVSYAHGGDICLTSAPGAKGAFIQSSTATFYLPYYSYNLSVTISEIPDDFSYEEAGSYKLEFLYSTDSGANFNTVTLKESSSECGTFSFDLNSSLSSVADSTITGRFRLTLDDSSVSKSVLLHKAVFSVSDGVLPVNEDAVKDMSDISCEDANETLCREIGEFDFTTNSSMTIYHADYVIGSFTYDDYAAVYGESYHSDIPASKMREYESKGWIHFDYSLDEFMKSSFTESDIKRFIEGASLTTEGISHCPLRIDEEHPLTITALKAGKIKTATFNGTVSNYRLYGYTSMPKFLFGTDSQGRDMFKLVFNGLRYSVILGVVTSVINLVIGLVWGAVSGYFGGWTDIIMERVCEILGGIPWVVVMTLILINKPEGTPAILMVGLALCATGWLGTAGLTRTQFYRFKDREYILAARTLGASDGRLIFRHILPNAVGTLITSSVLMIPSVIFSEASISYLGLVKGMQGFGSTLSDNQIYMSTYPYLIIFPSVVMALIMISFNLFGNGLRDAFNPSLKGGE